jgi:hypothetical protein
MEKVQLGVDFDRVHAARIARASGAEAPRGINPALHALRLRIFSRCS